MTQPDADNIPARIYNLDLKLKDVANGELKQYEFNARSGYKCYHKLEEIKRAWQWDYHWTASAREEARRKYREQLDDLENLTDRWAFFRPKCRG